MGEKRCAACERTLPSDRFARRSSAKDGLQSWCRECSATAKRQWRESNEQRVVEYNRQWRAENPEAAKAATEAWRSANAERYAQSKRDWQDRNRDRRLEQLRAARAADPEKYRAALSTWKAENRDRVRDYQRKRRAAGYGGAIGAVDGEQAWSHCEGRCAICSDPIDRSLPWPDPESASLDHIRPLSKGGAHDQGNVQWTHLVCNLRKGVRAS